MLKGGDRRGGLEEEKAPGQLPASLSITEMLIRTNPKTVSINKQPTAYK